MCRPIAPFGKVGMRAHKLSHKMDVILPDAVSNKGERPGKGSSIKVSNVGIKMRRQLFFYNQLRGGVEGWR
jgi:hypothetical protein